jgi:hypothetical protein
MALSDDLLNTGSSGMYVSLVCNDESIYEGIILSETASGVWLSIGGNSDRVILFPWASVNRVVAKRPRDDGIIWL